MSDDGLGIGLAYLPTELYDTIIAHLEAESANHRGFQLSLLALSRAIPKASLSLSDLYREIALSSPRQARNLYLQLRKNATYATAIKICKYECFEADPDIIVNLLAILPSVTDLTLFIGPHFSPEHLEAIFEQPRSILKCLSLRFRPYVNKAAYYQFHKGSYFDSTLTLLSAWPRASLDRLSITQDPIDLSIAPKAHFAQPLVFFQLEPVSILAASPIVRKAASVRFRIPHRDVILHLHRYVKSLPKIKFLDVATCKVHENVLVALLADFDGLQSLILDGCPIVSQRTDAVVAVGAETLAQWKALGKALATVNVKRTRDKDKAIKELLEQRRQEQEMAREDGSGKRTRRGRRGVATATISLRGVNDNLIPNGLRPKAPLPPAKDKSKEKDKPEAKSNKSERNDQPIKDKAKASTSKPLTQPSSRQICSDTAPIRIIPSAPALRALAVTAPMASVSESDFKTKYDLIKQEFEEGWADGVRLMNQVRRRIKTSWYNGLVRAMTSVTVRAEGEDNTESGTESERSTSESSSISSSSSQSTSARSRRSAYDAQFKQLCSGLREIISEDDFELDLASIECPVLCLAGPKRNDFHPAGCPHETSWRLWGDEL